MEMSETNSLEEFVTKVSKNGLLSGDDLHVTLDGLGGIAGDSSGRDLTQSLVAVGRAIL